MNELVTDLNTGPRDPAVDAAAATTIRRTAARIAASSDDLDQALAALFAPPRGMPPVHPSKIRNGHKLSPTDADRARQLVHDGLDNAAIAADLGCSVQAVIGIRVGIRRRQEAAQNAVGS